MYQQPGFSLLLCIRKEFRYPVDGIDVQAVNIHDNHEDHQDNQQNETHLLGPFLPSGADIFPPDGLNDIEN
jgi:hypothetical protein